MTDSATVRVGTDIGILRVQLEAEPGVHARSAVELPGRDVRCLLVLQSGVLLCGTTEGLFRRPPRGGWVRREGPLARARVTALAAGSAGIGAPPRIWAGTEPSAVFRSDDDGLSWRDTESLDRLPSSLTWSYPPRPDTHHVRALAPHPIDRNRILVGIEAGAVVATRDGGSSWVDRRPDGPRDPHRLLTRADRPGTVFAAAGDGWFETPDFGERWTLDGAGMRDGYVWDAAVDEGEDVWVAVAAPDALHAHGRPRAEARVYRRVGGGAWEPTREGLPPPETRVPVVTALPGVRGGFLLATQDVRIYRSDPTATRWRGPMGRWPGPSHPSGVRDVVVTPGRSTL